MSKEIDEKEALTRRNFFALTAGILATSMASPLVGKSESVLDASVEPVKKVTSGKPNILFIFTDQERYFHKFPKGLKLPAHERLQKEGMTFNNHYVSATMCTSSRSVMMTGLQTTNNGMFDNVDMPYVNALDDNIPTVGDMLRSAGYYTAYKGKWHLNRDFETDQTSQYFQDGMDKYGFSDFNTAVDAKAHTLGGYKNDQMITASAIDWMRKNGQELNENNKPWSLFVSLINPHDIMYFNTDAPGESIQNNGKLMMEAARTPNHSMYSHDWKMLLPKNLTQPFDEAGRPPAHGEFSKAWGYVLGNVPPKTAAWDRFQNFYINSIRTVDQQMETLLNELDRLGLRDNTVIVFTADHGEMGGAHGLRGKGPFVYEESIHVPFYISHPAVKGGTKCHALTSHIDIVPTLLDIAGAPQEASKQSLPGKSLLPLLLGDKKKIRDSILFTYSGLATNDSETIRIFSEAKEAKIDPKLAMKNQGYKPNLKKRGSLRCVFDGRYKFTRYFSPMERNMPQSLDELLKWNDLELYDLQHDTSEMNNLALDATTNRALIEKMNEKLNHLILSEIGEDDGREMPKFGNIEWMVDKIDL
jgi:arylsulfatase